VGAGNPGRGIRTPDLCNAKPTPTRRCPAAARVSLGLDQPFAIRFGTGAFAALQGDLGNSLFSGQSIVSMIAQRIPPTLSLMILTLLISVSVAVPLGVVAAARQELVAWRRGVARRRVEAISLKRRGRILLARTRAFG
jgi:ABC-type dipeptide/oligopeptide/nickel transport system permease component